MIEFDNKTVIEYRLALNNLYSIIKKYQSFNRKSSIYLYNYIDFRLNKIYPFLCFVNEFNNDLLRVMVHQKDIPTDLDTWNHSQYIDKGVPQGRNKFIPYDLYKVTSSLEIENDKFQEYIDSIDDFVITHGKYCPIINQKEDLSKSSEKVGYVDTNPKGYSDVYKVTSNKNVTITSRNTLNNIHLAYIDGEELITLSDNDYMYSTTINSKYIPLSIDFLEIKSYSLFFENDEEATRVNLNMDHGNYSIELTYKK